MAIEKNCSRRRQTTTTMIHLHSNTHGCELIIKNNSKTTFNKNVFEKNKRPKVENCQMSENVPNLSKKCIFSVEIFFCFYFECFYMYVHFIVRSSFVNVSNPLNCFQFHYCCCILFVPYLTNLCWLYICFLIYSLIFCITLVL